jgi:flagellar motility protein MotE (MotC chaperone)
MASLFANALIVKRNNPDYLGGIPRTFEVNMMRQPDMGFFKGIWQTLSTGIKSIAGYDEATEKVVKQHIAQRKADRNNREIKKALRKQRRALRRRNRN